MTRIFSAVLQWLIRQAVVLLLILAVLLGAAWVNGELKRADELRREQASLVARKDALQAEIDALKRSSAERAQHAQALSRTHEAHLQRKRAERQALWEGNFWARKNPLSDVALTIRFLDAEIALYEEALGRLSRAREMVLNELNARVRQNERAVEEAARLIADADEKLARSSVSRLFAVARAELPTALAVLLGILLLPIAVKAFLYYVVAPLAQRRAPIRLLPSASGRIGAGIGPGKASAVSIPITLGEGEELLVRPGYLQSTSLQAHKSTQWLLNAGIPVSSLLSGMYMLTRVGPAGAEPIVVSATRDPFGEVGIVELAEGAAFACQPRGLVGVIQERARPIRITRHWRLGTLQAWLTLQLRFLVFHGPGRLVLKGCRGIRVEQVGTGRLINQAATLGFSANLAYANTRCETFVAYWAGKEDLFNDLFTGESGVYVYEETPDLRRAAGAGRHLQGFLDALLKVFGI